LNLKDQVLGCQSLVHSIFPSEDSISERSNHSKAVKRFDTYRAVPPALLFK